MTILVVHHRSNQKFLKDLIQTLPKKYQILIVENEAKTSNYIPNAGGYELGALKKAMSLTDDDIFLLQDTCLIKNPEIFDIAASHNGGMAICTRFMSYLGK